MPIRESSYGTWSSDQRFLWVATGAIIGMGNVMRLPLLAGEYGGGAFLIVYGLALLIVGWPMLVAELALARWARGDPVSALEHLADAAQAHRAWSFIGILSCITAVLVLSYFSVVAGWSLAYAIRGAGGALSGVSAETAGSIFYGLAQDPERSLAWHTIFIAIVCVIVAHGHRDGIERAARYLFPAALVLGMSLLLYGAAVGDVGAAVHYIFAPDWARLGWHGALEALHQAFFTLALGAGILLAYGSYLPARANIPRLAAEIIVLDTLFSLVVGVALYALVFAASHDSAPGLTLLFKTLPQALPAGVLGTVGATLVYAMLFVITVNAAMGLMEPGVRVLMDRRRITRVFATVFVAITVWFIGIGSLLSFSLTEQLHLFGRNFFDWAQWLTGRLLLPIIGLLLCIFTIRLLPAVLLRETWGEQSDWSHSVWKWMLRYPTRIALIVLLLYCLGLLDFLSGLWAP